MSQPRIEGYYKFSNEKAVLETILKRKLRSFYSSILDVGAGNGDLARLCYERTDNLQLCEINPFYEDILKEKFPEAQVEMLDVNLLELKSYELVLFSQGLYYHPPKKWEKLISRLVDSLSSTGELVLVLNKSQGDWWEAIRSVWEVRPEILAFSYIPSEQFISNLSKNHKVIEVETFIYNMNFPDTEARDHYLRKSCIPLSNSDATAEKLIEDYICSLDSRLNFQYSSEVITLKKYSGR